MKEMTDAAKCRETFKRRTELEQKSKKKIVLVVSHPGL